MQSKCVNFHVFYINLVQVCKQCLHPTDLSQAIFLIVPLAGLPFSLHRPWGPYQQTLAQLCSTFKADFEWKIISLLLLFCLVNHKWLYLATLINITFFHKHSFCFHYNSGHPILPLTLFFSTCRDKCDFHLVVLNSKMTARQIRSCCCDLSNTTHHYESHKWR